MEIVQVKTSFEEELMRGLTGVPKQIPSFYFYDQTGDSIFQEIMNLPEYYVTRAESGILKNYRRRISDMVDWHLSEFNLVELGAGDGLKTKILLRQLIHDQRKFIYTPVDISESVLNELKKDLHQEMPGLVVNPISAEYLDALQELHSMPGKKAILFLGANIGNFTYRQSIRFLTEISSALNKGDIMIIGFDRKKDPAVIHDAYNDQSGVTERFNKNLLARLNKEFAMNFDPDKFHFHASYDPSSGAVRSHLVSKCQQTIKSDHYDFEITFEPFETIFTEISQKFSLSEIHNLAESAGFEILTNLDDDLNYFTDSIWIKKWFYHEFNGKL